MLDLIYEIPELKNAKYFIKNNEIIPKEFLNNRGIKCIK